MKMIISILLAGMFQPNGLYDMQFTTIEGQQHTLNEYQGQKILIVVLPATQTGDDSTYLARVDSVALANSGQVKTIAVPSYEDGYADSLLPALQPFYRGFLDTSISITAGMYTHQASGAQQNPLFGWLTYAAQNTHFEEEVGGPGEMYFIDGQGNLYGVFGPEAKYSDKVLNNMLRQTNN